MRFAALIIDMQEDFFAHERLARGRAALTSAVNDLVRMCREASVPVVWVKQEWSADLGDAMLEARRSGTRIVIAGTPGAAILPQLDHRASDPLVVKKRYSAFFGTQLDGLLGRLAPSKLIVAGINTHACVRMSVVDAYQRDYDVILARDCVDSYDAEHHDVSLRYMDGNVCGVLGNAESRKMLTT